MYNVFNLEHDAPEYLIDEKFRERLELLLDEIRNNFDGKNHERLIELAAIATAYSIIKDYKLLSLSISNEEICNSCYMMDKIESPIAPALCIGKCPSIRGS